VKSFLFLCSSGVIRGFSLAVRKKEEGEFDTATYSSPMLFSALFSLQRINDGLLSFFLRGPSATSLSSLTSFLSSSCGLGLSDVAAGGSTIVATWLTHLSFLHYLSFFGQLPSSPFLFFLTHWFFSSPSILREKREDRRPIPAYRFFPSRGGRGVGGGAWGGVSAGGRRVVGT